MAWQPDRKRDLPVGRSLVQPTRYAVVSNEVELLRGNQPRIELFPDELISRTAGEGKRGRLVEPRKNHVARASQRLRRIELIVIPRVVSLLIGLACEGMRRAGGLQR